jgi:acyl dehydratase
MNLEALKSYVIPPREHAYDVCDALLYALGLGYGDDPLDEADLAYVFEEGLKAVPSMCNTIAHPGFWLKEPSLEIDWVKALHAEQSFTMHTSLPPTGRMRADYAVVSVEDKGVERGAILTLEKTLTDCTSGVLCCSVRQSIFLRGDGGHGSFGVTSAAPGPIPSRSPDLVLDIRTPPQLALIYRLSGDYNPVHASPAVARAAGFDRPILHGLCTMGLATRALLRAVCQDDPAQLVSMFVRFSAPVFPGETIRTEIFLEQDAVRFRCRVTERDVVVIDRGATKVRTTGARLSERSTASVAAE